MLRFPSAKLLRRVPPSQAIQGPKGLVDWIRTASAYGSSIATSATH